MRADFREEFEGYLQRIRNNDPELTSLTLHRKNLNGSDINKLAEALAKNSTLTTLIVSYNQIGDEGAKALAQNNTITTLEVGFNQIGDEGAQALAKNATITRLYVGHNQIGDEGAQALAENSTITTLNVNGNQIGYKGAQALAENSTITTLEVGLNQIGDEGVQALARNRTITTLDVGSNQIGYAGVQALAENNTITTLDVSDNQIGDAGAQALADNSTITTLDVGHNQIGYAGVQALARNRTITTLNIDENQIGAQGAQALAENNTITTLNVRFNQIGYAGVQALAENNTITTLDVSDNQIGGEGAQALAKNATITSLDVRLNQIGAQGAQALAKNATITRLNVTYDNIGDAGVQALTENTTMTSIYFYNHNDRPISNVATQALEYAIYRNQLLVTTGPKLYQQYLGTTDATLSPNESDFLSDRNHPENALYALNILYNKIKESEPDKIIKTPEDLASISNANPPVYVGINMALELASKASDQFKSDLPDDLKKVIDQVQLSSSLRSHGIARKDEKFEPKLGRDASILIESFVAPGDIAEKSETKALAAKLVELQLRDFGQVNEPDDFLELVKEITKNPEDIRQFLSEEELSILNNPAREELIKKYFAESLTEKYNKLPNSSVSAPHNAEEDFRAAEEEKTGQAR